MAVLGGVQAELSLKRDTFSLALAGSSGMPLLPRSLLIATAMLGRSVGARPSCCPIALHQASRRLMPGGCCCCYCSMSIAALLYGIYLPANYHW